MPDQDEFGNWSAASAPLIGGLLKNAGVAVTAQDADLRFTAATSQPYGLDGASLIGRRDEDVLTGDVLRIVKAAKDRAIASAETQNLEVHLARDDRDNWYRVVIEPLVQDGHSPGVLTTSVDITQQKISEEHLRLALIELAHRSKNLLAVVLSIARQSTEESASLSDFGARFVGRIRALSLAHDVLPDELWRGATVFSLVRSQLSTFEPAPRKSTIEGHNAYLKPNAVQHVGLALHELIAQSILSGALAQADGRILFTSSLVPAEGEPGTDLVLRWQETGIKPAASGHQSPFGRALLERIVPAALSGSARREDSDAGTLAYELRMPSSQFF